MTAHFVIADICSSLQARGFTSRFSSSISKLIIIVELYYCCLREDHHFYIKVTVF
jgi:hypothetical protein